MDSRLFGQRPHNLDTIRVGPDVRGQGYKFTLLLPVLKDGNQAFSPDDEELLRNLFSDDFGGYTCTAGITHPLLRGGWVSEAGQYVTDYHTRFEVYAKQTPEALEYFRELSQNLARYSRDVIAGRRPDYGGEEQILIELTTVSLI